MQLSLAFEGSSIIHSKKIKQIKFPKVARQHFYCIKVVIFSLFSMNHEKRKISKNAYLLFRVSAIVIKFYSIKLML